MGCTLLIILLLVTLLQAFSTTTTTTTNTTVSMSEKTYDFATWEFPCRRCKFYMRVTSGTTAAPPAVVAAAMPENPTSPSKKTNVGAVVGFTFLLVFILTTMFVCIYRSRRSRSRPKPADHKQEVANPSQSKKLVRKPPAPGLAQPSGAGMDKNNKDNPRKDKPKCGRKNDPKVKRPKVRKGLKDDDDQGVRPNVPKDDQGVRPNVPKDPEANDQGIMPKVPKDDQGVRPKVPNDDQGVRPKVPKDDQGVRPKVPNDDQGVKPKVPKDDQGVRPKVPKDDQGVMPKVPNDDQGVKPKVPKDDQGVTPKVPKGREANDQIVSPKIRVVEPGDNSLGSPKTFTYKYLTRVTNNFDFKNMIGGGTFGNVFKGTLADGTVVAVKCLRLMRRRVDDFKNEVDALAKADHFNLVKLIGYCDKSIVKILVFEYMKNGSLDRWIFNTEIDKLLNWPEMKNIIRGIALGLEYLHEKCEKKILHRDLKPANIILDENKNAKLCDFGLAKLLNKDQTSTSTACAGSWVYMAPEAKNGRINDKVDVYSFGAVVLEIMFGKHFVELVTPEEINNVKEFKSFEGLIGNLREDLRGNGKEITLFAKLAMYCLNEKPENRPNMSDVVKIIDGFETRLEAMKLSEK